MYVKNNIHNYSTIDPPSKSLGAIIFISRSFDRNYYLIRGFIISLLIVIVPRHNIKIVVALIKTRTPCGKNAESSLPSTHNKSIYFLLLFFFPFQRIWDISVRAAGMRSRRCKQDSRIKRKFLSGASMLFSLFLFLLENERKRWNRREIFRSIC